MDVLMSICLVIGYGALIILALAVIFFIIIAIGAAIEDYLDRH